MAEIAVSCLILAAGTGQRLGLGPKAFLELRGRPLMCWVADKAMQVADEVLVAVPRDLIDAASGLLPGCRVVAGGTTRQDSIACLVREARGEWLMVHDAARPFASVALMQAVLDGAWRHGCAGAFLSPQVPVARLAGRRVVEAFAGDEMGIFQTPQVYARQDMATMLRHQDQVPGWFAQSAVQLALAAGIAVHAVPGEAGNFKITGRDDWHLARALEDQLA